MKAPRQAAIILLVFFAAQTIAYGVDVSDLGVPAGLSAGDYDNRGNDLLNKGDYVGARKYLDAAIRVQPDRWSAYYNRALTYMKQKNWTAAVQDLNRTIKLEPAFFEASWFRALIYQRMENFTAALKDLDLLAELTVQVQQPGQLAQILNERAWIRATCSEPAFRDGSKAMGDAKRACGLTKWRHSDYIDTLAAACAEAGDFESAVRYEEKALEVNGSDPQNRTKELETNIGRPLRDSEKNGLAVRAKNLASGYRDRLALYQQHRPYREHFPR